MIIEIKTWQSECESFQNWFSALGGNIANNEQMTEAFNRIKSKEVSDNNLYRLLEEDEAKQIQVTKYETL